VARYYDVLIEGSGGLNLCIRVSANTRATARRMGLALARRKHPSTQSWRVHNVIFVPPVARMGDR
jgi:hypothetical protein